MRCSDNKGTEACTKLSQLKTFTGHFCIFKEVLIYIDPAKGRQEGGLKRQSHSSEITMDRFKNTQTWALEHLGGEKGTLCELSAAAATSNNAPRAILKTLCEKQNQWVKDEKPWSREEVICALSPDHTQSFRDPAHTTLRPKVEKHFKFP